MAIDVYLNFEGNCREAVEFYAKTFETGQPQIIAFGDTPPDPNFPLPEEAKNLVMHARLSINGSTIMFSDTFPGMTFIQGNNISLSYSSKNVEEIKSLFGKLADGGTVGMDLQQTSWSQCYGNLTDKFGIQWQFNYDNGEY
jgi:PhnB protein